MSVEARDVVMVEEVGPDFKLNNNLKLVAFLRDLYKSDGIQFQIVGGILDMLYKPGTDEEKKRELNTKVIALLHPVATAV